MYYLQKLRLVILLILWRASFQLVFQYYVLKKMFFLIVMGLLVIMLQLDVMILPLMALRLLLWRKVVMPALN